MASSCNGGGGVPRDREKNDNPGKILFKIRNSIEAIREETKADIDKRLDLMTEHLVDELKRISGKDKEFEWLQQEDEKRVSRKSGQLPEKQFQPRNSLLTDLFTVKHVRTIYHIYVVSMLLTLLNTVVHDVVVDGTLNLGLRPFLAAFGKFHIALLLWLAQHGLTTCLFFAFIAWAAVYYRVSSPDRGFRRLWNMFGIVSFATYQVTFFYVFTKAVLHYELPHASSVAALMEMTRFAMKSYAFIRSNVPKVTRGKEKVQNDHGQTTKAPLPTFGWYQYFLFCPTLVYRDSYPRTKQIRWRKVFSYLAEMIMVILFLSFIFERFAMPYFGSFGETEQTPGSLVMSIFGCILPGITIFMCGFYSFLHVWMNMWAEMLRFADRMFYSDWWTATSFDVYYRKWNVVVHDWLFTYVYKDLYETVFIGQKIAATAAVFSISAVVHEFIIAFAFRFFYPVLFVLFEGFGLIMMFIPIKRLNSAGNIFLWLALCLGNGIQLALYTIEHFARKNCQVGDSVVDYMVPVSWSCNNISSLNHDDWQIKFSF